ncbi:MAG: hypothetical protein HY982_01590 [Candidatus Magasanikbacteria bacterium]|nr:hypothetical protein [Candidatus Magasanikbacteria bacterium]
MNLNKNPNLKEKTLPETSTEQKKAEIAVSTAKTFEAKEADKVLSLSEIKTTEEKISETVPAALSVVSPPPPPIAKDPHLAEIESILTENLKEAYWKLPPEKRREFKAEGERIAGFIWQMVETAKIQVRKIISLISDWLKKMPGLNRYFIEQESKIKTDKIIILAKKHGTRNHSA